MNQQYLENPWNRSAVVPTALREALYPRTFRTPRRSDVRDAYLSDSAVAQLLRFFEDKGLAAIKEEDRREQWYADWLAYQASHRLYARLLTPRKYASQGTGFDLLRYARFLEVFAYSSPGHAYSLQVTFLGFFSILMGAGSALKREAVAALEAGKLLAFGVSERAHGADLLGNTLTVTEVSRGCYRANGSKYYIGNSNCAAIISILARKADRRGTARGRRAPFVLFALRPEHSRGYGPARKISTLGVRAAFVGAFDVKDHELSADDVIAEGRNAWDAVLGAVTLGKFFLGFGSIGICEHALVEAVTHLRERVLYGKPVIDMPHIRATMVQAYARLTAMKLYAYRALDYVQAAGASDRRYLLFTAVQKAKVSTEGVTVAAMLSECIGAKGFESETYFEMALRDVQLIPGLEGSTHINLGLTARFIPRYFARPGAKLPGPPALVAGEALPEENPYLMEARSTAVHDVLFPRFLEAFAPLMSIGNVRLFVKQAKAFELLVRDREDLTAGTAQAVTSLTLALGRCLATIAYAQLVAEGVVRLGVPAPLVCTMFHSLVNDFNEAALRLASCCEPGAIREVLLRRLVSVPRISDTDYDFVSKELTEVADPGRSTV